MTGGAWASVAWARLAPASAGPAQRPTHLYYSPDCRMLVQDRRGCGLSGCHENWAPLAAWSAQEGQASDKECAQCCHWPRRAPKRAKRGVSASLAVSSKSRLHSPSLAKPVIVLGSVHVVDRLN